MSNINHNEIKVLKPGRRECNLEYTPLDSGVPLTIQCYWDHNDGDGWEPITTISAPSDSPNCSRSSDSIRWSDVTKSDIADAIQYLDSASANWPKDEPHKATIGTLRHS